MIDKKLTALLGSALLIAAAMPLAMAHTSASDKDVSGNYYGAGGAFGKSLTLFPNFEDNEFFAGSILCDMEVLGPGDSPAPVDEEDVDGNTGGNVPDGVFDDGGTGGACHTQGHYGSNYDTAGCSSGLGDAKGADASSLVQDLWLSASCDWKATSSGPGLSTCVVNAVIGGSPTTLSDELLICVANFTNGNGDGSFQSCGSDGVADGGSFEWGSIGAAFPTDADIALDGCTASTHSSAAIFTFAYVSEDSPLDTSVPTVGHVNQG